MFFLIRSSLFPCAQLPCWEKTFCHLECLTADSISCPGSYAVIVSCSFPCFQGLKSLPRPQSQRLTALFWCSPPACLNNLWPTLHAVLGLQPSLPFSSSHSLPPQKVCYWNLPHTKIRLLVSSCTEKKLFADALIFKINIWFIKVKI